MALLARRTVITVVAPSKVAFSTMKPVRDQVGGSEGLLHGVDSL
jgi:hypothetical protein